MRHGRCQPCQERVSVDQGRICSWRISNVDIRQLEKDPIVPARTSGPAGRQAMLGLFGKGLFDLTFIQKLVSVEGHRWPVEDISSANAPAVVKKRRSRPGPKHRSW